MIETLNGIFETVNWKQSTSLKVYDNTQYEDYPAHWHVALEVILPLENIYTVETPDTSVVLREGDIAILAPGCIHTLYAPPTGRRIIFQSGVAQLRFLNDIPGLLTALSPFTVITPEEYPGIHRELYDLIVTMNEEYQSGEPYSELDIYSKILHMFSLIGKNYNRAAKLSLVQNHDKQEEYYDKFMKICDYINEHCSEDLTLEGVAEMSGFSKFYFSKLFKQFTNVSFYRYVNQRRIAKAELMLINPENTVTDVALSCGFSSMSPFIRMFRQIKGCTPTEFRSIYK